MQEVVARLIKDFVKQYPERSGSRTRWREPVIAFASADDELFSRLKEWVSPEHVLPRDMLGDARTVISYFVPYAEEVAISNISGAQCSWEWGIAFNETNKLIFELNTYLNDKICEWGYKCSFTPATHNLAQTTLMSNWSHRHIAYICGLGTFGQNNMLITAQGCCGRLGTLVTDLPAVPTVRPEGENCLYKHGGKCLECVSRCVNNSLTVSGFDRYGCYAMCLSNEKPELGLPDVCGKCTVNVPCSHKNPSDG